jgi:cell wall-associated NlpC family hydrolase
MSRLSYLRILAVLTVLLAGCSSTVRYSSELTVKKDSQTSDNAHTITAERELIVATAEKLIGTPYCYGGEGTDCFDCSGFVNYVFGKAGINLPRVSGDIYVVGFSVDIPSAQPGDLVFFKKGNRINHVGIYVGDNKMIHASTSRGVILQDLNDSYYRERFAGIKDVISR